jgi:hypothetical protein
MTTTRQMTYALIGRNRVQPACRPPCPRRQVGRIPIDAPPCRATPGIVVCSAWHKLHFPERSECARPATVGGHRMPRVSGQPPVENGDGIDAFTGEAYTWRTKRNLCVAPFERGRLRVVVTGVLDCKQDTAIGFIGKQPQ